MLATASSFSSRTAGLLTVASTFTTSTLGTSSGRSPAGASPAGHRRAGATTLRERFHGAIRGLPALGVADGFDQFPDAADKALLGTQIDAHERGIDAECPRAAAGVGIEAPDYGLVVLVDGRVGVVPATGELDTDLRRRLELAHPM